MKTFKFFIREFEEPWISESGGNAIHASIRGELQPDNLDEGFFDDDDLTPEERKTRGDNLGSLRNHYSRGYSNQQKSDINDYTKGDSCDLNSYLWHKHLKTLKGTVYKGYNLEPKIYGLDVAMEVHKTPHSFDVWSSTKHDPRELKNSKGIVHHPAYLSTSIDRLVAKKREINAQTSKGEGTWAGGAIPKERIDHHILKIRVPEGHHGILSHSYSDYPEENEFILPRGLKLKYHGTRTESYEGSTSDSHRHYHDMEIVK